MSTLMLLLLYPLWKKSGSQQAKEIQIFHKTIMSLSYGLFVRKKDTSIYTRVSSIHTNGESLDGYRERINSFLSEYFSSMEL